MAKKSSQSGKSRKSKSSLAARRENHCSTYWRNKADRIWSKTVRRRGNFKCAVCGSTENLQAHHLIAKKGGGCIFRHDLDCGLCLCGRHHGKWGAYDSAHSGHLGFALWLNENRPDLWEWVKINITKVRHKGPYPKIDYKVAYETILKIAHEDDKKGC